MKKITVMLSIAAVIFCLSASFAAAQTKPNLNGTWKMNPSKSKFENQGPNGIIIKLEQKDSSFTETITISGDNEDRTINLKYTTDGKEAENQVGERLAKVTAKWEAESLVVEMKAEQGLFIRKFTISADGKTITMAVDRTEGTNATVKDIVFLEKQ